MKIISNYSNGNVNVKLFEDGSKIREFSERPNIIHPESIDVKITNYCEPIKNNPICGYCHEKSSLKGQHGDLNKLANVLSCLPAGVEIAIGGGNPLAHPDLIIFLQKLKSQGLICNITINQKHLNKYFNLIKLLILQDLVKGIGISYSDAKYLNDILPIIKLSPHVVFHVIMGINQLSDIHDLYLFCQTNNYLCKILILGYKQFGYGLNFYLKNKFIESSIYQWYIRLALFFNKINLVLSFDNLAISQLNLKRYFTEDAWNKFFMGDDFVFTMYIDGVEQIYAPSSTSNNRVSFNEMNLLSYFQKFKNNYKGFQ
jgi:hypothetical protein